MNILAWFKKDINIVGFVKDNNLRDEHKEDIHLYPIYSIKCKNCKELIDIINNQESKDKMYEITINKLISYERKLEIYNYYLKNKYYNSKKMFEDFLKVWLKNILQNPNIKLLPKLDDEILFYIY